MSWVSIDSGFGALPFLLLDLWPCIAFELVAEGWLSLPLISAYGKACIASEAAALSLKKYIQSPSK